MLSLNSNGDGLLLVMDTVSRTLVIEVEEFLVLTMRVAIVGADADIVDGVG